MNSLFNNKPFDEIDYQDIQELVNRKIPESLILDYKGDILQTKLKGKEFGKDISSFANTFGGWIIYGIQTNEKDEIIPLEENAIIGLENQSGLKERIENMILSSISPKPLYRIKKIDIANIERCIILIYIPQSYNHLHMVVTKDEMKFYKRYEFQSHPMDYFEIKRRFEELGQTEEFRKTIIDKLLKQLAINIPDVDEKNLFAISSIPKFLIENHFNNKQIVQTLQDSNRQHTIIKYGRNLIRKTNRFSIELIHKENWKMATINCLYNGIVIQIMPVDLYDKNRVNLSALCHYIYYFLDLIIQYYSAFNFQGIVDIRFDLRGITGRKFTYSGLSNQYFNRSF
ncbi:MAG: helix-turn-helix domain-containing protein [Candidatus Hodarchaeota archaeon]